MGPFDDDDDDDDDVDVDVDDDDDDHDIVSDKSEHLHRHAFFGHTAQRSLWYVQDSLTPKHI